MTEAAQATSAYAAAPTSLPRGRSAVILVVAFFSGMTVLAVEISASRLLAPFFGTSIIIWSVVIGLTLLYLSVGYWIGGRVADRFPRAVTMFDIVAVAAFLVGLVPVLARPVLSLSSDAIAGLDGGLFFGSLIGVLLLFAIPLTMLGMVSPYAIRLLTNDVAHAGRRAGQVFALSTVGSILGAFLPVLVLTPTIGTRATFLTFSVLLVSLSLVATPVRSRRAVFAAFLVVLVLLWIFARPDAVRPSEGLIFEGESAIQFIQVIDDPRAGRRLVLNEGIGTHSVYRPDRLLTDGPWDYFLLAPLLSREPTSPVESLLIIGLGGGTVARQFTEVYGADVMIDGVEVDPRVIEVGREYFNMRGRNLTAIADDGRTFLRRTEQRYDVIAVDAYRQPYIPFHLVTREFFEEAAAALTPDGVLALNAGRTQRDFRLVDALGSTMGAVFPHVYVIDLPSGYSNSLIFGTRARLTDQDLRARVKAAGIAELSEISARPWTLRKAPGLTVVYTDDLAPVERLIDDIITREALGSGAGRRR